jgi:hypothetical protein
MKPQILKADFVFFLDDLELYQSNPYKLLGGPEMLEKIPVKTWTRVNVATGEDVDDLGYATVSVSDKGHWFVVEGFPKDHAYPALVGTRK